MRNFDSEEMARRGRLVPRWALLRAGAKAAKATRGNKERGAKISVSLRKILATPKAKAHKSALTREQWKHAEIREKMIDGIVRQLASNPTRTPKFRDTKPELVVRAKLEAAGVVFVAQFPMFGTLWDFAIPETKTIIEVDGCYWHGCPKHHPNQSSRRILDRVKTERARAAGWRVIRIWEHDIMEKK